MNRAAKNVLRKLGTDIDLDEEREELTAREQILNRLYHPSLIGDVQIL